MTPPAHIIAVEITAACKRRRAQMPAKCRREHTWHPNSHGGLTTSNYHRWLLFGRWVRCARCERPTPSHWLSFEHDYWRNGGVR